MPLFVGLAPDHIADVVDSILERRVKAGKVLIKQGQWGHEVLLVLEGELEVQRDGDVLAVQGPGEIAGEVAVLTGGRRNATVVARTDAVLGVIEYSQAHVLVDANPVLADRLGAVVHDRDAR
jgi:CRP-like cAMP-binding protein